MPPLQTPRLKLVRAFQLLDMLKEECRKFGVENRCEWTRHLHEDGTGECFIKEMPVPPLEWGIHVGKIAYQLHSALDSLAWQVSRHNDSKVRDTTYPTAGKNVEKIVEYGILHQAGASAYSKTYIADRMLEIIEGRAPGGEN